MGLNKPVHQKLYDVAARYAERYLFLLRFTKQNLDNTKRIIFSQSQDHFRNKQS